MSKNKNCQKIKILAQNQIFFSKIFFLYPKLKLFLNNQGFCEESKFLSKVENFWAQLILQFYSGRQQS